MQSLLMTACLLNATFAAAGGGVMDIPPTKEALDGSAESAPGNLRSEADAPQEEDRMLQDGHAQSARSLLAARSRNLAGNRPAYWGKFMGCYEDSKKNRWGTKFFTFGVGDQQTCSDYCFLQARNSNNKPYKFAAYQWEGECWCSDDNVDRSGSDYKKAASVDICGGCNEDTTNFGNYHQCIFDITDLTEQKCRAGCDANNQEAEWGCRDACNATYGVTNDECYMSQSPNDCGRCHAECMKPRQDLDDCYESWGCNDM